MSEHQELVEGLRVGVMTDYGGTVLCNEIQPDPPNRGPNCEAIITLKEGAQPKKQRAMPMHGERLKALEFGMGEAKRGFRHNRIR